MPPPNSTNIFGISLILISLSISQDLIADAVSFIACPVYRDTDAGPKSGCWLASERNSGITYDIGSGLTKPIGENALLVEGRTNATSEADSKLCGGIVLSPVRVSVLEQQCTPHMLPAEGYPGRVFRPPGEVMRPLTVERTLPEPPYDNRTYTILFNFNSDFLNYQYSEVILEKMSLYSRASDGEVTIVGYAATDPFKVSNQTLQENVALAESRAKKVEIALLRLGVEASKIKLQWRGQAEPVSHYAGGLEQETLRRVDVIIKVK